MQSPPSETVIRHKMDRLLEQAGRGDACHRAGFGFIHPAGRLEMRRHARRGWRR